MVAHWDLNNRLAAEKLVVDSRYCLPACSCHEIDFLSLLDPVGFPDQISDFFCHPGSEHEAPLVRDGLSRLDS